MRPLIAIGLAVLLAPAAHAEDLLQVFDRATTNDPQIREADATRKANREARPQAWAAVLPQLSASAAETRDQNDGFSDRTQIIPDPTAPGGVRAIAVPTGGQSEPESTRWSVDLRQSVFSWADWVALKRASKQVAQAEADYLVAQQDLALRVATRYFDVLAAQDNVQSQQTALDAISRQLEQAEKRFEVGLIAITDVQEAKAARDNGAAALIAAKRQLASSEEFLRELIGDKPQVLAKPVAEMPLATPNPAEEQQWVDLSMQQNTALTSSRLAADIARDNVRAAFGGHLPTIDFVASRSGFKQDQTVDLPPESVPPNGQTLALTTDTDGTSYSLQFSLPLFSGGAAQSRVRESEFRWLAARERLERTSRQTERLARDAYLGVLSGISRVQALKQALESTQTALKATEAGYEVGTRTAVDVLDSRRRLAQSETDYARARYDYILSVLQLRLAAGTLDRKALEEVNSWLAQQ